MAFKDISSGRGLVTSKVFEHADGERRKGHNQHVACSTNQLWSFKFMLKPRLFVRWQHYRKNNEERRLDRQKISVEKINRPARRYIIVHELLVCDSHLFWNVAF